MLVTSLLLCAFAATGLAQAPEGYRAVYITSMVNTNFVVVPKARTGGSTLVMFVRSFLVPPVVPAFCKRYLF